MYLTFWLELSTLSFSIAISTTMIYTSIHFYIKNLFFIKLNNLQWNHHKENYKLIELAAKVKDKLESQTKMLNHKDGHE